MDLNLDTLKQEILAYLEHAEFAVFRSAPGGLEGLPMVLWDAEGYPDYQMFLETARKTGAKMILFAAREFETSEVDEAVDQLDECDLSREERRELEARLRDLRAHEGVTCALRVDQVDHVASLQESNNTLYDASGRPLVLLDPARLIRRALELVNGAPEARPLVQ